MPTGPAPAMMTGSFALLITSRPLADFRKHQVAEDEMDFFPMTFTWRKIVALCLGMQTI
jgi:hypothetical protein